jgi:predicted ATPase
VTSPFAHDSVTATVDCWPSADPEDGATGRSTRLLLPVRQHRRAVAGSRFLRRVVITNYKSIGGCDVTLEPLTFLVGPNGAGKSNFLDALRFVADALNRTVDHALRDRGGINEVRRRSGGHPIHFGIRLDFELPAGVTGSYAFRVGSRSRKGFEVQREDCVVHHPEALGESSRFRVISGEVESTIKTVPPATPDRLYLTIASGLPEFRSLFDTLSQMGFYNLNPDKIRGLQPPDPGFLLARDGSNLASVLGVLSSLDPSATERVEEYLRRLVPGVEGVSQRPIGPRETIEFRQQVAGTGSPWRFLAASMSDGTLRALGVLAALFQSGSGPSSAARLVGIEEPEVALHPAAAGVLLDALREASRRVQVVVTSHSPDLLDSDDIDTASLLAVTADQGVTVIGAVDEVGRSTLRDRLFTPGELLRLDQLTPDPKAKEVAVGRQLNIFESMP